MKIRKSSIASTKRYNRELKSKANSSCHHTKTNKMKANNSTCSSLWRRVLSIGLLLQILVNCGKFNYITFSTISLVFICHSHFHLVRHSFTTRPVFSVPFSYVLIVCSIELSKMKKKTPNYVPLVRHFLFKTRKKNEQDGKKRKKIHTKSN